MQEMMGMRKMKYPYRVQMSDTHIVCNLAWHIARATLSYEIGYRIPNPTSVNTCDFYMDVPLEHSEYGKKSTVGLQLQFDLRHPVGDEYGLTPLDIRMNFRQYTKPWVRLPQSMLIKPIIDDDFGNHHWYIDPVKFKAKILQVVDWMELHGIGKKAPCDPVAEGYKCLYLLNHSAKSLRRSLWRLWYGFRNKIYDDIEEQKADIQEFLDLLDIADNIGMTFDDWRLDLGD